MSNSENKEQGANSSGSGAQKSATPVYRKPVIRKYDQIEQVKPYGPSEKEAG